VREFEANSLSSNPGYKFVLESSIIFRKSVKEISGENMLAENLAANFNFDQRKVQKEYLNQYGRLAVRQNGARTCIYSVVSRIQHIIEVAARSIEAEVYRPPFAVPLLR
jgi:hypothetical protein